MFDEVLGTHLIGPGIGAVIVSASYGKTIQFYCYLYQSTYNH